MTSLNLQPGDWDKLTALHERVGVLFTTPFCGGCRMLKPTLEKNASQLPRMYEIDASAYPEITQKYNVKKAPTLILFHKGEHIATLQDLGEIKVAAINGAYEGRD